ncbi:MAG TPA: 3-oxoacyl-[acyl-carrier-protein] synthase III C-terminal domain-containing protein [Elusimicrobiota bacterium]|nr:3-oxoacyl-[acyl-carrier-protein] synthase III C-terminal domain-containing protein [Elusimicrobiota bacterium]
MRKAAYLHDFRPLSVGAVRAQADIAAWLKVGLARTRGGRLDAQDRRALALYERFARGGAVESRASALPDYGRRDWDAMTLFRATDGAPWHRPTLQSRMALYEKTVLALAGRAFPSGESAPDYAIQVSCTGYASPHAVQRLAARRAWDSRVLHVGHMGCYASVPAAAMASKLVLGEAATGRPRARASLLLVELCSLHLKPGASADEQVVVNSLFGDGAIRFDASLAPRGPALALLDSAEEIVPGSEEEMTWRLEDSSFQMTLTRDVPGLVGKAVSGFVRRFLKRGGRSLADVSRFAIHPGGPRVIEQVLAALALPADAAPHSREVLRRRGNMSSATLPHIWHALLEDPLVRDGELILSLAFGPGLTLVANLLRKERRR